MAAEGEAQKELDSNPQYTPALMVQAGLLAQRGQIKPAIDIYTDILRRLPDFAPAQKRLAMLYAQIHPQSLPPTTWPQRRAKHCRMIPNWPSFSGD